MSRRRRLSQHEHWSGQGQVEWTDSLPYASQHCSQQETDAGDYRSLVPSTWGRKSRSSCHAVGLAPGVARRKSCFQLSGGSPATEARSSGNQPVGAANCVAATRGAWPRPAPPSHTQSSLPSGSGMTIELLQCLLCVSGRVRRPPKRSRRTATGSMSCVLCLGAFGSWSPCLPGRAKGAALGQGAVRNQRRVVLNGAAAHIAEGGAPRRGNGGRAQASREVHRSCADPLPQVIGGLRSIQVRDSGVIAESPAQSIEVNAVIRIGVSNHGLDGVEPCGSAVVAASGAGGSAQASVVSAGVLEHPVTSETVVGWWREKSIGKLQDLRARRAWPGRSRGRYVCSSMPVGQAPVLTCRHTVGQ